MSPTAPGSLASLDGEIALAAETVILATDDGLLRGDGVFEAVRVYDGRPFALEAHLERLQRSADNLRLELDLEAVRADAHRLLARAGGAPEHASLRIVVTRGGRRLLLTEQLPATPEHVRLGSVTYAPTRVLDSVKSLSYAGNMLCSRLAREQGYDEALLVTPHGRVLEAPTSSIFYVKGDRLLTPPLSDHILDSITRRAVLALSDAREQVCTIDDLKAADEAFLASSIREVQPVAAVDGHEFNPPGPVTAQAAAALREHIRAELAEV